MMRPFLLLAFLPFLVQAQIQFEEIELGELLNRSKKENKPVFIYGYASWCEPCEELEAYTFSDLEVANFFKRQFLCKAIDMDVYPGVELAERYKVDVYPTFLFLNEDGEVMHRGCGSMDASDLLLLADKALERDANLLAMEMKYKSEERSTSFLLDYLETVEAACLDAERTANDYLEELDKEALMEETGWAIFSSYHWDIFSDKFQYLSENKAAFEEQVGSDLVNAKLYDSFLAQYQEVYASEQLHDFGMRALIKAISERTFIGSDTLLAMMNLHYTEYTEDWPAFAEQAIDFVGMMEISDPSELAELAWKFYLFVDDKNQLVIASGWAKEAVDVLPEPSIIDTYAALQFKLGNRQKAVELERKALELAIELNENVEHYEYQLRKFEEK